jgi:hypothetical protein
VNTQDGYDWPTPHPVAPTIPEEGCALKDCSCARYGGSGRAYPACGFFLHAPVPRQVSDAPFGGVVRCELPLACAGIVT